jgi:tetratricopeptide (TPR) repeat protein
LAAEFVQLGRSFVEQGQLQEAVRVCRLGLLANPGEIEGRLVLGTALMALARFDEVLAEMKSALDMESHNPSALALKGEALLRKGDAAQAQAVLDQAAQFAFADPYIEALQSEAAAAVAGAPPPTHETLDIDPELEGVEIHDEAGGADISDSGIELLDEDLLMEATPTPEPQVDNLEDDIMTVEAPPEIMARLDSPADGPVDGPFEDLLGRGRRPSSSPPVDAGGWSENSTARHQKAKPARDPAEPKPRFATVGTLFPDDESGVSGLELTNSPHGPGQPRTGQQPLMPDLSSEPARAPRGMNADMDLIRGGVGPEPAPAVRAPQARPVSMAAAAPVEPRRDATQHAGKRKFKVPKVVWGVLLVGSVAGGFFGGLEIREQRLASQIRQAQSDARSFSSDDSYLGYRKARDLHGRVVKVVGDDPARGALARSEAALAAEFGHSPGAGAKVLAGIRDKAGLDALAAGAYIAIANGDHSDASEKATQITEAFADEAVGHYLLGRAKILSEDPEGALVSIDKALKLGATPLAYVAQARAEALRGRYPEALTAIAKAREGATPNAAAIIWQSRILLLSGELPKNASDPDDQLQGLIVRSRSRSLAPDSISPAQGAWAGLVLAEIKLQRGDLELAKKALAEARVGRPTDWLFSEMLADILVRLGQNEEAKDEALRAVEAWPQRSKPRIVLALVALLDGDPEGAIEALEDVEGMEALPDALIVRGRANLELGKLEAAVSDLDKALSVRGRDSDALIARAKVDILRGDSKSAIGRLEPMYDRTAAPNLAIAYASALRTSGKSIEARKVLEPLAGETGTAPAFIELAALERSEGRFAEARNAFRRAIELEPRSQNARLGAALLEIEDGQIQRGREGLDALVGEGTGNGLILVEAARARIWTGDAESAEELLNRTAESSSWLNWQVARERGRILLRHHDPIKAISELQRAQSLRPTDIETRILLMEAHFDANIRQGSAERILEDITKSFRDSPLRLVALGIHSLLHDKAPEAVAAFAQARSQLLDQKGSRLDLARAAYWLGRAHEFTGDLRQSAQWLEKATKLNKSHSGAYFWLGQVKHREQQPKAMAASYEKAVAIDPSHNALAWFFLGSYYAEAGKKAEAVKALESFLRYYHKDSGDVVVEAKTLLEQLR